MFNDIKVVCSRFFEEYDMRLLEVRDKMGDITLKYKSWSKVLIEPSSLNDARLYSLETRLQKEEDMRINEFMIMQDWVKKLLYALEQKSMSEAQSQVHRAKGEQATNDTYPERQEDNRVMLPKLTGFGIQNLNLTQSMDISKYMSDTYSFDPLGDRSEPNRDFQMRIKYLRDTLSSHNSKAHVLASREDA